MVSPQQKASASVYIPRTGPAYVSPSILRAASTAAHSTALRRSQCTLPISAVIIAGDSAATIKEAVESVLPLVSEVVVVVQTDPNPVKNRTFDDTARIAQSCGERVRVIRRAWPGLVAQKVFARSQTRERMVLEIDADEAVTPELAASIRECVGRGCLTPQRPVALCAREIRQSGRRLQHCGEDPWKPRLFLKEHVEETGSAHEDAIRARDRGAAPHRLEGWLLHEKYMDVAARVRRIGRFAQAYGLQGDEPPRSKAMALFRPLWRLVRMGVFEGELRDGLPGYFRMWAITIDRLLRYGARAGVLGRAKPEETMITLIGDHRGFDAAPAYTGLSSCGEIGQRIELLGRRLCGDRCYRSSALRRWYAWAVKPLLRGAAAFCAARGDDGRARSAAALIEAFVHVAAATLAYEAGCRPQTHKER